MLLSFHIFTSGGPCISRKRYYFSLLLFASACLTKTVTSLLPIVIIVDSLWRHGTRVAKNHLIILSPWLLLGTLSGLSTIWMEHYQIGFTEQSFNIPLLDRLPIIPNNIFSYLSKAILPINLSFFYPNYPPQQLYIGAIWKSTAILGSILIFTVQRKIRKAGLAILSSYLVFLLPASGIFSVYPFQFSPIADHFQYHSLPFAAIAITCLLRLIRNVKMRNALALCLCIALPILTSRHAAAFATPEKLYLDVLKKNSTSWIAQNNLANIYANEPGFRPEVMQLFRFSLVSNPTNPDIRFNYANYLSRAPEYSIAAANNYAELLRNNRVYPGALNNFGKLLAISNQHIADAYHLFLLSIKYWPESPEGYINMGKLLMQNPSTVQDAEQYFVEAIRLAPGNPTFIRTIAIYYLQKGDARTSKKFFSTLFEIAPSSESAFSLAVSALRAGESLQVVLAHLDDAIILDPTNERALQLQQTLLDALNPP